MNAETRRVAVVGASPASTGVNGNVVRVCGSEPAGDLRWQAKTGRKAK
jgi:hypothetical protein